MCLYRLQALCIEIFKTIKNLTPEYIKVIFELTHKTRSDRKQQQKNLAKLAIHTSTFGVKGLSHLGSIIWTVSQYT